MTRWKKGVRATSNTLQNVFLVHFLCAVLGVPSIKQLRVFLSQTEITVKLYNLDDLRDVPTQLWTASVVTKGTDCTYVQDFYPFPLFGTFLSSLLARVCLKFLRLLVCSPSVLHQICFLINIACITAMKVAGLVQPTYWSCFNHFTETWRNSDTFLLSFVVVRQNTCDGAVLY